VDEILANDTDPGSGVDRHRTDTAPFRTKRQLWTYSGLGIETHSSGDYHFVEGQSRRAPKQVSIRGLNSNHDHDRTFGSCRSSEVATYVPARTTRLLADVD